MAVKLRVDSFGLFTCPKCVGSKFVEFWELVDLAELSPGQADDGVNADETRPKYHTGVTAVSFGRRLTHVFYSHYSLSAFEHLNFLTFQTWLTPKCRTYDCGIRFPVDTQFFHLIFR